MKELTIVYIFCLYLITRCNTQDCQSGYNFTLQPPQILNCNPTGTLITVTLYCFTSPRGSYDWYHTTDPVQAGKSGKLIVNSNTYTVSNSNVVSTLNFKVSSDTVGFYWCIITSNTLVPTRSSTVTTICLNYNNSLPTCDLTNLYNQHHDVPECADANMTFPRQNVTIPTDCIPEPSSSSAPPLSTTPHGYDVRTITSLLSYSSLTISSTISTILISSSSTSSTLLTSSLSTVIQTSTSTPIPSIVSTPMPNTTEPTLNIGPSPTATSQSQILLYSLIGICILLAIIALIIAIAIIILCCMTRRQHSLEAATPKGSSTTVQPVAYRANGISTEETGIHSKPLETTPTSAPIITQDDDNMIVNVAYVKKQQTEAFISGQPYEVPTVPTNATLIHTNVSIIPTDVDTPMNIPSALSFSNPIYSPNAMGSISVPHGSSAVPAGSVPPPKQLPPNSPPIYKVDDDPIQRPYYAKPDITKKRSHSFVSSQEREVSTEETLSPLPPTSFSPPPPIPPQTMVTPTPQETLYDEPEQSMTQSANHTPSPALHIHPRLVSQSPVAMDTVLYDTPNTNLTTTKNVISADYDDPDDLPRVNVNVAISPHQLFQNGHADITPSKIPNESTYEDPWGPLPTGIKRGSTKSRGSSKSRSTHPTHSTSPSNNIFDDPMYDVPTASPNDPTSYFEEAFGYTKPNN